MWVLLLSVKKVMVSIYKFITHNRFEPREFLMQGVKRGMLTLTWQDVSGKLIFTELVLLHLLCWLMNLICISPGRFLRHFLISAVNLGKFLYVVLPDVILKVAEILSSTSDLHMYCIWEPTRSYYPTIKYSFPSWFPLPTPVKLLVTPKEQKGSTMKHNSWVIYFLGCPINKFERRGDNISRVIWGSACF